MDDWDLDEFQPIHLKKKEAPPITSRELAGETPPPASRVEASVPSRKLRPPNRPPGKRSGGCFKAVLWGLAILAIYFFGLPRTNFLLLGIDRTPEGTALGRSDTIILTSVQPLRFDIKMLSIPRDLWVSIPGFGENRINAAHVFGEGEQPGSGPRKTMETVQANFGVRVGFYLRLRLEGFADIIDAFGGVDVVLDEPVIGLPPGEHHLDGTTALAFVRDRTGDDFFRMRHGQLFIRAMVIKMLNPLNWLRLPGVLAATVRAVDTNIPIWQWPRLGLAFALIGPGGIDARTLDRTMVTGWTTDLGAAVLLPNWDAIMPLVREMFGG
jgi:LCP family protein required for cell wall assembly